MYVVKWMSSQDNISTLDVRITLNDLIRVAVTYAMPHWRKKPVSWQCGFVLRVIKERRLSAYTEDLSLWPSGALTTIALLYDDNREKAVSIHWGPVLATITLHYDADRTLLAYTDDLSLWLSPCFMMITERRLSAYTEDLFLWPSSCFMMITERRLSAYTEDLSLWPSPCFMMITERRLSAYTEDLFLWPSPCFMMITERRVPSWAI